MYEITFMCNLQIQMNIYPLTDNNSVTPLKFKPIIRPIPNDKHW